MAQLDLNNDELWSLYTDTIALSQCWELPKLQHLAWTFAQAQKLRQRKTAPNLTPVLKRLETAGSANYNEHLSSSYSGWEVHLWTYNGAQ